MALDEGTSSARAILFDRAGNVAALAQREFRQIYPQPGWVEHDAVEIWTTQLLRRARGHGPGRGASPATSPPSASPTSARPASSGTARPASPLHNALVWQDRRTAGVCDALKARGLEPYVKETTGLVIDAYFSGTKIAWVLDNVPGARARAERGELAAGTIDTWLIWNLTGGKVHVTDASNASRTLLFNIRTGEWDDRLLGRAERAARHAAARCATARRSTAIPTRRCSAGPIPVASSVGDQQGALFGQSCFEPGMVKATYGTGGSLMMNAGPHAACRRNTGLLTTVAWRHRRQDWSTRWKGCCSPSGRSCNGCATS